MYQIVEEQAESNAAMMKDFAPALEKMVDRAGTREFPPGKSREFPENFQSRLVPGIFSISREISGNFYVL